MICLAKWMARSAFGIGLAIGILAAAVVKPVAEARPISDPVCPDFGQQPQAVQDFIDLHCAVHSALFNDGSTPGAVFLFDADASKPGKYAGKTWDGRTITLEAIRVVDLDMKHNQPDTQAMGFTASFVVGTLVGPAGTVSVTGTYFHPSERMAFATTFAFQVSSRLTEAQYDTFAQLARVQAGVRVLDVNTFRSYPLARVTGFDAASSASTDPATVFGTNVNGAMSDAERAECVKAKYDHFNIDVAAAERNFAICAAAASAALVVWLLGCAGVGSASGPLAPAVYAACCLVGAGVALIALGVCLLTYQTAIEAAAQHLTVELRSCGIYIA